MSSGYLATRVLSASPCRVCRVAETGCGMTRGLRSQACASTLPARELLHEGTMANTLELLQLLGKAWVVTLTCLSGDDQWQLRIESHPAPRWDEYFAYTYRGSLASVVARAYAGEPDDGHEEKVEQLIAKPTPSAGRYQPLGDPNASCTGTYPDVDGTYADCGDYNCPRHVPAALKAAKPEVAS